MSYATPDDVAARLGKTFSAAETAQAQAFLDDAEANIRVRIPDLDAQMTAGAISVAAVVRIEANAVRRVMLNPTGVQSHSEGWAGGFTEQDTFNAAFGSGELVIDQDDLNQLESKPSLAFSIQMAYSPRHGEMRVRRPWEFPGYWWS